MSGDTSVDSDDLTVEVFQETILVNMCIVAGATLCYYDLFLTFADEYHCIWTRRFSGPTVFFFINRYFTLIDLSFLLVNLIPFGGVPFEIGNNICNGVMTMSEYIEVIIYINSSAIVCLRLHAIWSKNLRILLLFALLGLVRPTIRIYLNNQIKNVIQPFIGCGDITNIGSDSIVLIFWMVMPIYAIVNDALILAFTWAKTAGIRRMSKCGPVYANHSIVVYLLRDGTIYFLCLITLYITTLAGAQSRLSGGIPIITEALSSILVSRFILNLRGVYLPNDNQLESFRPSKMSNLHFASQIVGNLGAPLSLSSHSEIGGFGGDFDWETEEGTVEVVQESSNPLSVGLESLPLSVTMP